jgi:ADP-heptose:LPS heptosyltransferase/glycosyltransferase involved in cell wall biosynthesis
MHLVIDMQGIQTRCRDRWVGCIAMSFVKAMVRQRGESRVTLALNGLFAETIGLIIEEFEGLLPAQDIRVWQAVGPTKEIDRNNQLRREVSERLREAYLESLQPDLILIVGPFEGYSDDAVVSIGTLGGTIPVVALVQEVHSLTILERRVNAETDQRDWYLSKLESLKRAGRLLTTSEFVRGEAARHWHIDARKIDVISPACEPSFHELALTAQGRDEIRERAGIQKPFVMYVGDAGASKNLARLVESFARLPRSVTERFLLALVGDIGSQQMEGLKRVAVAAGLQSDELRFTGLVVGDRLVELYNSCALVVCPSLLEENAQSVLEAMSCGAPVIASDAGCLPEIIGLDDALFDPESCDDMGAKMLRALTDESYRSRLLAHARRRSSELSWDNSAIKAWSALRASGGSALGAVSPQLSVDVTGIFKKRHLRILAIKLDHLGDFILSIPALTKLRAKYPYSSIDIVVGSWNRQMAADLGLFRNIYAFDYFKRKSSQSPETNARELAEFLQTLGEYDIAIDLRRQPETRFLLAGTKANLKVGYETFDAATDECMDVMLRSHPDANFVSTPLNKTPIAIQMLRLIDALPGDVNDYVSFPAIGAATERATGRVAIFPRAGTEAREWPHERVVELVARLLGAAVVRDLHLFFVNQREAAEFRFGEDAKLKLHVGMEFSAVVGLLSSCHLCIANNSGGIHLASYLGVPAIGVYSGHELASEWGPQFDDSIVIHRNADCAPCHLGRRKDCPYGNFCLADITVDDVYQKAVESLEGRGDSTRASTPMESATVRLQRNGDTIVRNLIKSVVRLADSPSRAILIETAAAIASNHPSYAMSLDRQIVPPNTVIGHQSTAVEWIGFSASEAGFRWTNGERATVQFNLEWGADFSPNGRLLLAVDTFGRQRIGARFNGIRVYDAVKRGRRLLLDIPVANLRIGRNRLELELPDAVRPGTGDSRRLGLAVRRLKISVDTESLAGFLRLGADWKDRVMRLR